MAEQMWNSRWLRVQKDYIRIEGFTLPRGVWKGCRISLSLNPDKIPVFCVITKRGHRIA